MTDIELTKAKNNYDELLKNNNQLIELREKFLDFSQDSKIQEYLYLKNWHYFDNRIFELEQMSIIKKYLYIIEEYNGFKEKTDYELVEEAFDKVINNSDDNNIYVYIGSYKNDKIGTRREIKDNEKAEYHLYKNLETMNDEWIPIDEVGGFKKNNIVIVFKNKRHKPIELFYRYRVMYLRQFLLDNHENLFSNKKLVKELKVSDSKN